MSAAKRKTSTVEENLRPTLRDVAKLAGGVHPSTVSLAMRNHPGISETLRKKIKAAAKQLGYRPDPLLDAFNTHRVAVQPHRAISTLAWIVEASSKKELLDDPFSSGLLAGAMKAAEFFHCQLEIFYMGGGQLSPSRLNTVLKTRGIVGVVCANLHRDRSTMDLDWKAFCPIRVESSHLPAPLLGVAADHRQGLRLALQKVRESGPKRIGLALSRRINPAVAELQRIVWSYESHVAGEGFLPPCLEAGDSTPFEIRRWAKARGLEALILNDHRLLYDTDKGEGRENGGLTVACLDASEAPAWLSGTVVDAAALGLQAVEQTVVLMRSNERGNPDSETTTYLPMSWRPTLSKL